MSISGKNDVVAGITTYDGSWIGLWAEQSKPLHYVNGSQFLDNSFGFDGNVGERIKHMHEKNDVDACISVDRRGTSGNWNVVACDAKRASICELEIGSTAGRRHCNTENTFDFRRAGTLHAGEYMAVNDMKCGDMGGEIRCGNEEGNTLEIAQAICVEKLKSVSNFDRMCCGGRLDNAHVSDNCIRRNINSKKSDMAMSETPIPHAGWLIAAGVCVIPVMVVAFVCCAEMRKYVLRRRTARGS